MLTKELVHELFDYNKHTGQFTHKVRSSRLFDSEARCKHWNNRFSGEKADWVKSSGYAFVTVFNKSYRAHRVAYLYVYGRMPENQIDHINGNRSDNRILNLRVVSNAENGKNQKLRSTNTTGVTGVWFSKAKKKLIAEILVNGKKIHLGTFDDINEAKKARKKAEQLYGFHRNHGRSTTSLV